MVANCSDTRYLSWNASISPVQDCVFFQSSWGTSTSTVASCFGMRCIDQVPSVHLLLSLDHPCFADCQHFVAVCLGSRGNLPRLPNVIPEIANDAQHVCRYFWWCWEVTTMLRLSLQRNILAHLKFHAYCDNDRPQNPYVYEKPGAMWKQRRSPCLSMKKIARCESNRVNASL